MFNVLKYLCNYSLAYKHTNRLLLVMLFTVGNLWLLIVYVSSSPAKRSSLSSEVARKGNIIKDQCRMWNVMTYAEICWKNIHDTCSYVLCPSVRQPAPFVFRLQRVNVKKQRGIGGGRGCQFRLIWFNSTCSAVQWVTFSLPATHPVLQAPTWITPLSVSPPLFSLLPPLIPDMFYCSIVRVTLKYCWNTVKPSWQSQHSQNTSVTSRSSHFPWAESVPSMSTFRSKTWWPTTWMCFTKHSRFHLSPPCFTWELRVA